MPPVADIQLAEQYGVPVSLITSHREGVLREGTHWQRDGKRILWLAAGLSAIGELVAGLDPEKKDGGAAGPGDVTAAPALASAAPAAAPSPPPPPDPPEPPAAPRRTAMARVFRKMPNPCWVRCHLPAEPSEKVFDIRIRNANKLGPKAQLPVEQQPDGSWICTHPHHTPKPYRP